MLGNVILDSSVLVSAFLTRGRAASEILDYASRGAYRLCLSPILLEEVRRALLRPKLLAAYRYRPEAVELFCDNLIKIAHLVNELPEIRRTGRDPDDEHVIAAAIAGGAEWIVTGDDDLLTLGQYESICIVTVRDFLETLRRQD